MQSSEWAPPVYLGHCEGRLSVFRRIFAGDLVDLLPSQLLWGDPGRIAGVAEETVQAGRRHDPEQEQFVIGIGKPMPGIPGMKIVPPFSKGCRTSFNVKIPLPSRT
jgi:hypothetical protein